MNNGFKKLEANPSWKGDKVKHSGIHCWVRDNWGKPSICECCGTTDAKLYDWSSKDHKYSRNREDWQRLCRSCHLKYDNMFFGHRKTKRFKKVYEKCQSCERQGLKMPAKGLCSNCYRKSRIK